MTNGVRRVIAETPDKAPKLADGITVLASGVRQMAGDYVLLLDIHSGWTATFDEKAVLECHWSLRSTRMKSAWQRHLFFGRNVRGANSMPWWMRESGDFVRRMGDYLAQKASALPAYRKMKKTEDQHGPQQNSFLSCCCWFCASASA